jgi:hypothetical protein
MDERERESESESKEAVTVVKINNAERERCAVSLWDIFEETISLSRCVLVLLVFRFIFLLL